jgi:hypothetical protein
MPDFTPEAERMDREYQGIALKVPTGYDLIDDADFRQWVYTQTATVVGNAFGGFLRRKLETVNKERTAEGKKPLADAAALKLDFQAEFDRIFSEYTYAPSERTPGGKATTDPIKSLALALAEIDLIAKIKAKGLTPAAFRKVKMEDGRTKFSHYRDEQFALKEDEYMERAKAQMEASEAGATGEDDLDLTL